MITILFINWNQIGDSIIQATRTFFGMLAGYIYDFIAILYNLFELIAVAEFLDNEFVRTIYRKIGLILGLFMVFKLSFSLIQSLIDPDKFNDKKTGFMNIIGRCIISIVLMGVTPAIFREAFDFQRLLIGANDNSDNIIYKLIIGKNVVNGNDFGIELAGELFFNFYTDAVHPKYSGGSILYPDQFTLYQEASYDLIKNKILGNDDLSVNRESFTFAASYLAAVDAEGVYLIEFDMIFCIIVGCVVAWILLMYSIQTAVRVIQLAYLQLIAPVPIFSYISDPEGSFKKWTKQCFSTYLDLFIRLAIIYFIVYLITFLLEQFGDPNSNLLLSTGLSEGDVEFRWLKIFLIIGLLLFGKKVPELLKDLFPNMGGGVGKFSFGLNPKKEVIEPFKDFYNKTPIGWAPKALGWTAKKTIGFVDRKVHGLPKPRGKFGQFIDKLAPGHAEYIKNKKQAQVDAKQWKLQEKRGESMYNSYNGKLTYDDVDGNVHVKSHVFGSNKYIETFEAKANAKNKVKVAEGVVERLNEDITAVSTDNRLTESQRESKLAVLRAQRDNAKGNLRAAESELAIAEERHKKNQAIYTRDAERERLFKDYEDMHKVEKDLNDGIPQEQLYMLSKEYQNDVKQESIKRQNENIERKKKVENAQLHFNNLNGVTMKKASDNGAPTESSSAIAEKYRLEDEARQIEIDKEVQKRLNNQREAETDAMAMQKIYNTVHNVTDNGGSTPKVTSENSILAKLAHEAEKEQEDRAQKEMQEEFKNRMINDSNNNNQ